MRFHLTLFLISLGLTGCGQDESVAVHDSNSSAPAAEADEVALVSGIDLSNFDTTERPQDDFFRYVNGTWLDTAEIPADRSGWGATYEIHERNEDRLKKVLEESAATDAAAGTNVQMIGGFYASYMDEERANELGIEPLRSELDSIAAADSHDDITRLMGHQARMNIEHPFKYTIARDLGDTSRNMAYIWQGGLALPDRDYYLEDDEKFVEARAAFVEYVDTLMALAGFDGDHGEALLEFETKLAQVSWPAADLRDLNAIYNLMDRDAMKEMAPAFDWALYLESAGLADQAEVVMETPSFFKGFGELYSDSNVDLLKNYLRFKLIDHFGYKLSDPIFQARFDFYSRKLRGQEQPLERWQYALANANNLLSDALGEIYVERYFPLEAKARTEEMMDNLKIVMEESIDGLAWMGESTKEEAKKKLAALRVYVGYPAQWKSYAGLEMRPDDLVGNMVRAERYDYDRTVQQLSEPPIDGEFAYPTQAVNAYYASDAGELVFLAGYLQPPNFDPLADDATNYGALGSTIGHEISHAFDDKGRAVDEKGELRDWWTEEDAEKFKAQAALLVDQYNEYEPLPGLHVNGELTLGENIADLAGVAIAYRAYLRSLDGKEAPVIDGYTGEQRFFLSNAQASRGKWRDGLMREIVTSDPHSPNEYRVNGVLKNMPEFYAAFDVKEGDGLYLPPEQRVSIW
ncbi:MAG: M13 family metallopeptidase [Gammaproteobacteria bacterium]